MHPVTRSSARLGLRELAIADVEAVFAIYGSPTATEHLSFAPRNREQVEQIVVRSVTAATATPRTEYALAVIDLGLHRIWGARSPINEVSAKTMRAVGMVEEGTTREHVLKAGERRDSVVHAILDREFSPSS
ncbi:GNAT family N-acetyltransferase [Streptomyces avermitilis]|uniref:GNAT family N-acetyltransferase n=1 Tax=Streptomyces avermitilis TaxID=33903 RepID=UPI0033E594B3